VGAVGGVSLRAQVSEHVMPTPALALVAERGDVDRRDYDPFAGAGAGLGENPSVVVDDHAAARP